MDCTDVLRTYARQKGKPLIALVPDSLVCWLDGAMEGSDALQICSFYLSLILPGEHPLSWFQDCRFLNRLSPKQLDQLRTGGKLTLRELSPVQREQLLRDIYFGFARLWRVYPALDETAPSPKDEEEGIMGVGLPHVFYPDGLPDDLTIQLTHRPSEEVGVFMTRRAGIWSGFQDTHQLAYEIHYAENSSENDSFYDKEYLAYLQERANRYKTASLMPTLRKLFRLEVRLGERRVVYLPSSDGNYPCDFELLNDGKPVTLDTLPEELRTRFEKYLKWYKESHSKRE